jgi:hypothetical protein
MASEAMTPHIIAELLDEAASARELAATFSDTATIRDFLNYAIALEADAARAWVTPANPVSERRAACRETLVSQFESLPDEPVSG